MSNILAIVAHPDDETFGCGGTLAHHAKKGYETNILCLKCKEDVRRKELKEAAKVLKINEPMFFDEKELTFENDVINSLSEIIVSKRPDIVITHLPFDYHRDHRMTNQLVKEAIEWAGHITMSNQPWSVKRLLAMEVNTLIPSPHIIMDVSDVFQLKMDAVQCYVSQLEKFQWGYYEMFNQFKARLRGVQGGCQYAEAFLEEPLRQNSPFYAYKSTRDLFSKI